MPEHVSLRQLLDQERREARIAKELHSSFAASVFDATSENGDDLRSEWVERVNVNLLDEAERIIGDIEDLIVQAVFSAGVVKAVHVGRLEDSQSVELMRRLKAVNFTSLMAKRLKKDVQSIKALMESFANSVFIAVTVRLVEGLNQQLADDEELEGIEIEIDIDELVTSSNLIIHGIQLQELIELTFADIFSELWFISNVTRGLANAPDLPVALSIIRSHVRLRTRTLSQRLKRIAFAVASRAMESANDQLASIDARTI